MKKLALIITAAFILSGVANAMFTGGDTDEATHNLTVTIPLFALVDVEDSNGSISLTPGVSQEAGAPLDFTVSSASYSSAFLNYTSVVGDDDGNSGNHHGNGNSSSITERKITAEISDELNGKGVAITVAAAAYSGDGAGAHGSTTNVQTLSSGVAKEIITGIGSCYTGNGVGNGHQLTYKLVQTESNGAANYAALTSGSYDVTITYTITD